MQTLLKSSFETNLKEMRSDVLFYTVV